MSLDKFDHEDRDTAPKQPEKPAEIYTAPNINSLYDTFRSTGKVPYSYYGVSAPTDPKELALVKQSYPGAFYQPPTPAPPPTQPKPANPGFNPILALISILSQGGSDLSPDGRKAWEFAGGGDIAPSEYIHMFSKNKGGGF